ncbi:MAG: DUF523 domain-containing protein [Syntrophorhabdaceae bacterium]|nr:DUF523 domain-containing protein [Syntrophorhabdaceae bacterium]
MKIKVGVSSCLLGNNVRYDGNNKLDTYIKETLGRHVAFIPVCPEVEYGLPVPREAMHLVGNPVSPRIITVNTRIDHTEGMKKWVNKRLDLLEGAGLSGFIFKSKSPSSGLKDVPVYDEHGRLIGHGRGIFARSFVERFPLLPVIDEVDLADPVFRRRFFRDLFSYHKNRLNPLYRPSSGYGYR